MLKFINLLMLGVVLTFASCTSKASSNAPVSETLKVETPTRPQGQTDVINLTTPKMDVVRIGFIGLGMRGPGAVSRMSKIEGTEIIALCDIHPERVEACQKILKDNNRPEAVGYSGSKEVWKELCDRDDIDLVYIATDWKNHAPMMLYAMEHGKHVACEVPSVMNMEQIWDVINTSERTRKHCMQLENCVYDFFELTTLNMAQQGLFGEIVHTEGAYIHCLEDFWDAYEGNWRLEYNTEHRGDIYATHGMGPACQLLDIHRGDKMNYLVAVDASPRSIPAFIKNKTGNDTIDYKNGEHTITLIKTEKGKTIEIQHNVASPRPYSRMYQLTGTEGFANKYPVEGYALNGKNLSGDVKDHENLNAHSFVAPEMKAELMAKYKHRIHKELEETARKVGGHGGMDFIMDYRLIYCLRNGLPLDMDVYDMAEWCCLAPLTELSLNNNSAPVEIPDFTRGSWNKIQGYRHAFAN